MAEPASAELANAKSATTSVAAIYQRDLMKVRLPIPPRTVQVQVAKAINTAIESADRAEHEATRALALLDRLEQSILARAFRGELVAQAPADEPAAPPLAHLHAAASPGRRRKPRA